MKISGISGADMAGGSSAIAPGAGETVDEVSRSLQKQIENLQKQMKELSANPDTPSEIKMRKRQELQKQISELQMQLRQHQMEVKREEAQKKEEKASQENAFDSCKISEEGRQQSAGLSAGSMEAMLSADAAMKQADVHGSTAQKMENRAGVLEQEIKLDQARGGDASAKKEELAEAKALADQATASQMESLGNASEIMKESGEKEQKDAVGKNGDGQQAGAAGEKEDTEKTAGENGSGMASQAEEDGNGQEGMSPEAGLGSVVYRPVDIRI